MENKKQQSKGIQDISGNTYVHSNITILPTKKGTVSRDTDSGEELNSCRSQGQGLRVSGQFQPLGVDCTIL